MLGIKNINLWNQLIRENNLSISYPYYETKINPQFSYLILSRSPTILTVMIHLLQSNIVKFGNMVNSKPNGLHVDIDEIRCYIKQCIQNTDFDFSDMKEVILH